MKKVNGPINNMPGCVLLDMTVVKLNQYCANIELMLNFDEEPIQTFKGEIRLGLRCGRLELKLENAEMPFQSRTHRCSLMNEISAKRKVVDDTSKDVSNEEEISGNLGSTADSVTASINPRTKQVSAESTGTRIETEFNTIITQVRTSGNDTNPVWIFASKTGEGVLLGEVHSTIGRLNFKDHPSKLFASIKAAKRDLMIVAADAFPENISINKLKLVQKLILKYYLADKITPNISELCFADV